jgi:hypothetical protein
MNPPASNTMVDITTGPSLSPSTILLSTNSSVYPATIFPTNSPTSFLSNAPTQQPSSSPTIAGYGTISYNQNMKVKGLKNGCQSFLNTTLPSAYAGSLSIVLNISSDYIRFSSCMDEFNSQQPSIHSDSDLSARITVPLYLYSQKKKENQTQEAFGYYIYNYLSSTCSAAVESGKFVLIFNSLTNNSSGSSSYELSFFSSYTSNYTFTLVSNAATISTSSTKVAALSFVVIFAIIAGGSILLVVLWLGYYLDFYGQLWDKFNNNNKDKKSGKFKAKVLPTSDPTSKYQPSSSPDPHRDMEAGFAELYPALRVEDPTESNPVCNRDMTDSTRKNIIQFTAPKKPLPTLNDQENNVLDETVNGNDVLRHNYRVKKKRVISKQALRIQEVLRQDFPTTENVDEQGEITPPPTNSRKVLKRRF